MKVRIQPQYTPCATHTIISGYIVYGWIGHPLLGKVLGTECRFETDGDAKRYARQLRLLNMGERK
jgi:hypothetical protein